MSLRRLCIFLLCIFYVFGAVKDLRAESCDTDCSAQCKVDLGLGKVTSPTCKGTCELAKALLICPPATIVNPAGPAAPLLPDEVKEAYEQARAEAQDFIDRLPYEAAKAVEDAINSADKSVSDTAKTLVKAADDIVDAGAAVVRFSERELRAYPDMLSGAEKRFREGKVVDAIWHLGTDRARATEENAGRLVQENEIVAVAVQAAAGFYGGPAGAAAFAAWKAYHLSGGNVDLAIKAGVLAYQPVDEVRCC